MAQWERARSDEQKQERMEEIFVVARKLLLDRPFDAIRLATIAKELSFTRANLYKYFQSKEEIYLSLLAREIESFAKSLHEKLVREEPNQNPDSFIDFWTAHLSQHRAMLMLLSVAGHILEKNVSDDVLLNSKKRIVTASLQWTLPTLQYFFPQWSKKQTQESLDLLVVLANGLFGFCGLSPEQEKLLHANGLGDMVSQGFDKEYRQMLQKIKFGQD